MVGGFRTVSEWETTGKYRPRIGWFSRVVLQIEEYRKTGMVYGPEVEWSGFERRWRDVTPAEMIGIRLRLFDNDTIWQVD